MKTGAMAGQEDLDLWDEILNEAAHVVSVLPVFRLRMVLPGSESSQPSQQVRSLLRRALVRHGAAARFRLRPAQAVLVAGETKPWI